MLCAANSMRCEMASLSKERQAVLAEGIACGWLAYRPYQGRMLPVNVQKLAAPLTSSRLDTGHLTDRYSFLDSAGKPTLHDSQAKTLQAVLPEELQTSYFEPDGTKEAEQVLSLDLTLSPTPGRERRRPTLPGAHCPPCLARQRSQSERRAGPPVQPDGQVSASKDLRRPGQSRQGGSLAERSGQKQPGGETGCLCCCSARQAGMSDQDSQPAQKALERQQVCQEES